MSLPAAAEAYELLERLRWDGSPPVCPHCGAAGRCHFLRPRAGSSRPTRTGAATFRRVWKCAACRRQFSVLTGTIFEGTRLRLPVWVAVVFDCAAGGEVPAAREICGRYGVSREAARLTSRRLTLALDAVRDSDFHAEVEAGAADGGAADGDAADGDAADGDAADGESLLAALLRLDAAHTSRIRDLAPGRIRPRRQVGPVADYGD
jgi:transposase-like protein